MRRPGNAGAPRYVPTLSTIPYVLPSLTSSAPAAPEAEPKGPSNLRLRVIWGALAAALLFGCTFGGPISFGLFFAAVQAVMLKEFYRIMRASGYKPAFWIGIVASVLVFAWVHFTVGYEYYAKYFGWLQAGWTIYPPLSALPQINDGDTILLPSQLGIGFYQSLLFAHPLAFWASLVALLSVGLLIREIVLWPNNGQPITNVGGTIAGLCYVSLSMSLLNSLAFTKGMFAPRHVFLLIFLIWAADTGAYFAGKNFGKHKLAPSISPGKTWEGWAGGALLTLAVGWAAGYFVPDVPLGHRLVAAGVVAVFGPLGDLAESMLKRSAGVKDSGTFLPGHGGLLDRFDAFLLVLPVLALLQALAG
ncbi:phosphatidate cytidylyltransferase [Hymenobacter sp. RP-2-7]|uniref:Phosphatidate cytidylyltransferase n=1 Tax=Hymenobacter polaris TaxID=2682546 RepID=A0A7Y0FP02_9BACT|nr:phosphatidate cytidylyltransferase [Hymenobacter polaris]NML67050.1 phosphatidate cytidylyltransferase [Hymenobacter polaris]